MTHSIETLAAIIDERDRQYRERWESQEKALAAALAAVKEAVEKAEAANGARFASVNEFRQTLSDQTATFMPRAEFDRAIGSLNEKLDVLRAYKDSDAGRTMGLSSGWGALLALVGVGIAVASIILRN
jgi:hypothetical protein